MKKKILVIITLFIGIICYFCIPEFNRFISEIFKMFASGNFEVIQRFVESYGIWAMLVSFLLMIFQSIIAPLPAFLITFANANLFGWWQGAILSWVSSMVGATICFYIARILGRDIVEKLVTKSGLNQIDIFFKKYGKNTILICRLLPFVSFDLVSYAAGLTSISLKKFLIATGIGQLPATLIYSYVGGMLTKGAQKLVSALMILFALVVFIFLLREIYFEKIKKR